MSPDGGLLQSSTIADRNVFKFAGGALPLPSCMLACFLRYTTATAELQCCRPMLQCFYAAESALHCTIPSQPLRTPSILGKFAGSPFFFHNTSYFPCCPYS